MEKYISESAKIGKNFKGGHSIVIQEDVIIGDDVQLGNYVIVYPSTRIGNGTVVQDCSVLGKQPALSSTSTVVPRNLPPLIIGENCNIGTSVIVIAGSEISNNVTLGDNAFLRESCKIGTFTVLGKGVSIENDCFIGEYCKIQTAAYITAYTTIEDYVFVAPLVITTNDNFMGRTEKRFAFKKGPHIKRAARIGAGAIILPGINIGKEAFVAAGSVVTRDVPDYKLVMGVPATVVGDVPEEELLGR